MHARDRPDADPLCLPTGVRDADALFDGRRFRLLTVVDHFTHESLTLSPTSRCGAQHGAETTPRLVALRGGPEAIKVDHGSEFAGKLMDRWAYENGMELDFPGAARRPTTRGWQTSTTGCGKGA